MRAVARSPRRRSRLSAVVEAVVVAVSISPALAAVACGGGDDGPTGPEPAPDPGTGSIELTTSTSGAEPDPDGYTVTVDGGEGRTIGTEDTLLVEGLQEGEHTVELSNLAQNCLVSGGDNPRSVPVPAGETASVDFAVACDGTSAVEVTTSTVAGGLDEDGFRVSVDGGATRSIGPDDVEVFSGVASGDHTVELSSVAAECTLEGAGTRVLTAPRGDTAKVAFEATCRLLDRIAFTSTRDGNAEIYVMGIDGSDPRRLTDHAASDFDPTWSPDGTRISFTSVRDGNAEIYVMEADGSNPTRITRDDAFDGHPAWSPDGSRIAFTSERDGAKEDIYVIEADRGSDPTRLTDRDDSTEDDVHPDWSPDASRIAFMTERDGGKDLYVMEADGSGQKPLTGDDGSGFHPSWSPDGTRIAFRTGRDGDSEIYEVCVDGTGAPGNLTDDGARDVHPAWSPDGSRIAFASDRDGDMDIYVMGTDGSNPTNLTGDDGTDRDPAWSPQTATGPGPAPGPSGDCQVAAP